MTEECLEPVIVLDIALLDRVASTHSKALTRVWCKRSNVIPDQHLRRRRGSLVQP